MENRVSGNFTNIEGMIDLVKETRRERLFSILDVAFMVAILLVVIIPLLNVVVTSFVSNQEIARRNFIIFPERLDFSAYKTIFTGSGIILNAYKITIFRVVTGTLINMVFTYFTAYALSKKDLPGRNIITLYFVFTMMFGGGLIPYYILIKTIGLMDNILVYILPSLISVWYTLLMRNFIMNIPSSLLESAEIDGANELRIIFSIVLPVSIPAMVTIALFYGVDHWNSWFDAFLFIKSSKKQPLQLILRNILASSDIRINAISGRVEASEFKPSPRAVQTATIVVSTIPIVMVYPFLQKYFIKGIMMGSIKG